MGYQLALVMRPTDSALQWWLIAPSIVIGIGLCLVSQMPPRSAQSLLVGLFVMPAFAIVAVSLVVALVRATLHPAVRTRRHAVAIAIASCALGIPWLAGYARGLLSHV